MERNLSQQALANRLGISASYVNLIEHDQRAISGALLIKLAEIFHLDLATLSGAQERQPEVGLREALSDPLLDADAVPDAEIAALAGSSPSAARAVLALYRAWRVAREDAGGIALPSGRRVLLPNEEARDAGDAVPRDAAPSSPEAAMLIRVVNYIAGAVLMPYPACLAAAQALRHDMEALAARFGVSCEQACHRLSTLQRPGARGVPFLFVRVDPAGNVSKRFSAAGFPFARYGGSCPRWVVHTAFMQPGVVQVQVAELPDGAAYLCFARTVTRPAIHWGEPRPVHVVAMGCSIAHAQELAYADGVDVEHAKVGIDLSCRLCNRTDCRSRAFPPLEHQLALDPLTSSATPYRFSPREG
jgi:transcriptional regulator with XRE-family HTH domain